MDQAFLPDLRRLERFIFFSVFFGVTLRVTFFQEQAKTEKIRYIDYMELTRYVYYIGSGLYRISGDGTPGGCRDRTYTRKQLPDWAVRWLDYQEANPTGIDGKPVYNEDMGKARKEDVYGPMAYRDQGIAESVVCSMPSPLRYVMTCWVNMLVLPDVKFERAINAWIRGHGEEK